MNFWAFVFGTLVWAPLVVYRVWRLLAVDEITEPARYWLSTRKGSAWTWLYKGLTCPWCAGLWFSLGTGALLGYLCRTHPFAWLGSAFATSAIVGVVAELVRKLEGHN